MSNYWTDIRQLARQLRKNQTPEEKIIWEIVRNRRFEGIKFYRQYPILYDQSNQTHFFIVDFYSSEASLVIEIDGKIHEQQQAYDQSRDQILRDQGLRVLRIKNQDVRHNLSWVRERIKEAIYSPPSPL